MRTAKQLRDAALKLQADEPKRPPKPAIDTVAGWAEKWQTLYPGGRGSETAAHNDYMVAMFARRYGRKKLSDIDRLTAQKWTVRHPGHARYLRLMFAKAVKAGFVQENVWSFVEPPRKRKKPRVPPSQKQLDAIVAVARSRGGWWESFADLIVFTAYSGLRLSEVADVQAQDVLEPGRVVVRGKRRPGEADPRVRVVAVFGPGREALERRKRGRVGRLWSSQTGRPLNRDVVSRAFRSVADEAGYRGSFHGVRHRHATWLRNLGADPTDIAQQLGHTDSFGRPDPTLVNSTYAHPDAELALRRLEDRANRRRGANDAGREAAGA